MLERARRFREANTCEVNSYDEFKKKIEEPGGFLLAHWDGTRETEDQIAAETKATVRLHLDLIKGKRIPWMRIEKPNSIVSVYAYRPLEVAVETATFNLMDWLISEYKLTPTDAYCLVSTCPDFRINVYQMCKMGKLSYVAGAEIPKRYLQ